MSVAAPERQRLGSRTLAARASWTIIDQGVSSLTNVVVVIAAAHAVSAQDFGRFSIVLTIYSVAVGLSRAVSGEPLLVVAVGGVAAAERRAVTGAAALVGLMMVAVVVIGNALTIADPLGWTFAAGLTLLLIQDAVRFVLIGVGRARGAAANDAVWLSLTIVGLVFMNAHRPGQHLAIWMLAGAVAAGAGLVQISVAPSVPDGVRWIRSHATLGRRFLAEFAFLSGASQIIVLVVGMRSGAADAGSMRAAGTMLGPAGVITNGLLLATVVETGRHRGSAAVRSSVVAAGGFAAAVMVACGLAIGALPDALGERLLGDTWRGASAVAPWLALPFAGTALATVIASGMRGSGRTRESVRIVTALATGMLIAGLIGSGHGPSVAAASMAIPAWAGGLVAVVRWRRLGATSGAMNVVAGRPTEEELRQ